MEKGVSKEAGHSIRCQNGSTCKCDAINENKSVNQLLIKRHSELNNGIE